MVECFEVEMVPGVSRAPAKAPSQRQLRVAEEVRHVLARVFSRGEVRDPDLAGETITVTEVRISPDLKNATAFVARLGRSDIDALLPALKRAAPFLRTQIAHEMRLRVAPRCRSSRTPVWTTPCASTSCCTGPRSRGTSRTSRRVGQRSATHQPAWTKP